MAKRKKSSKASSKKGLSVKTFKGLDKKRMKKGKGGPGKRVMMKQGDTVAVQFLEDPDEFLEFEIHNFQEDGRWEYVPCAGDECPLCESDSEKQRKTSYRFVANVYNLTEKRVQVLEGPKDLAGRIYYRYERNPAKFRKRAYDITKFPTQPVSYGVDTAEDAKPVRVKDLELHDLDNYLVDELKRYYGDELPTVASALDDSLDSDDFETSEEETSEDTFGTEESSDFETSEDTEETEESSDDPPPRKKSSRKSSSKSSKSNSSRRRRRR